MSKTEAVKEASKLHWTLDRAEIDVYVPNEASLNFKKTIGRWEPSSSLVASIPQRKHLFLDEVATVCVLLKTPFVDEPVFKSFVTGLEISIETYVVGTARPSGQTSDDGQQTTTRELIDSSFIERKDPETAISSIDIEDGTKSESFIFAMWKQEIHVRESKRLTWLAIRAETDAKPARSRIRASAPSLYFSVSLRFNEPEGEARVAPEDLMPPGIPDSINLLDAFRNDPHFNSKAPVLTLSRLSKMTPTSATGVESRKTLRNQTRRLLRLLPAVNTRIQFARLGVSPTQAKVVAALDVEASSFLTGSVQIEDMSMSLADGHVEAFGLPENLKLPITCQPTDIRSYAYNLIPHHINASLDRERQAHGVTFRLTATVVYRENEGTTDESINLPIRIQWRTPVDLSSLAQRRIALSSQDPEESTPHYVSTPLITMTVSGPDSVPVHGILRWNILLANRSMTRSLRLALIPVITSSTLTSAGLGTAAEAAVDASRMLKARARQPQKKHRHKPTLSASFFSSVASTPQDAAQERSPNEPSAAGHEASLSFWQAKQEPGLIPLTPDVRIGPLAPGESTEAQMQFLVLRPGILKVEAIRVVDLDEVEGQSSRNFVDVGPHMLPDIVAVVSPGENE